MSLHQLADYASQCFLICSFDDDYIYYVTIISHFSYIHYFYKNIVCKNVKAQNPVNLGII